MWLCSVNIIDHNDFYTCKGGRRIIMQQMNSGEQSDYGRYEGNQGYAQPPYEQAHGQPQAGATYDDNLVEALAQRVVQRMPQGSQGNLYRPQAHLIPRQRLALGIDSAVMLVPL